MKIAQITPGSGSNFYCENCLRDIALVKASYQLGHEVTLIPMYLPLIDEGQSSAAGAPLFFGGLNVFLQQKFAIFRHTPRWIDRLFDCPLLLDRLGRMYGMVRAGRLGEIAVSMLRGEHGRQAKELDRLITWLEQPSNKSDIVCLSNVLLAGCAAQIKRRLSVPVVCFLQDEEAFVDAFGEPFKSEAWQIVADCAADIDLFISVSDYYAQVCKRKMHLPDNKVEVVFHGIETDDYAMSPAAPSVPTIGFLSRACESKGLDILVDAFLIIKKSEKLRNARLRVAGGQMSADKKFIAGIRRKLREAQVAGDVEFLPSFDQAARREFLTTLSLLCVPERMPTAYGLYALEALACGVAVVEPKTGVFEEMAEFIGGVVLYELNDPHTLAGTLEPLLLDSDYTRDIGRKARAIMIEKFNVRQTARQLVRIYQQTIERLG